MAPPCSRPSCACTCSRAAPCAPSPSSPARRRACSTRRASVRAPARCPRTPLTAAVAGTPVQAACWAAQCMAQRTPTPTPTTPGRSPSSARRRCASSSPPRCWRTCSRAGASSAVAAWASAGSPTARRCRAVAARGRARVARSPTQRRQQPPARATARVCAEACERSMGHPRAVRRPRSPSRGVAIVHVCWSCTITWRPARRPEPRRSCRPRQRVVRPLVCRLQRPTSEVNTSQAALVHRCPAGATTATPGSPPLQLRSRSLRPREACSLRSSQARQHVTKSSYQCRISSISSSIICSSQA
mmetsp:Transcript_17994/g.46499  ORF Transcript_17994/g.46499 Transcript_17994/m.46499 type:complete len:301 (+) Transcript_17994:474-1376(+)